jgi:putative membrane protein
MATISDLSIGLVALLHVWFMVLEMFLWDKPVGLKAFGNTPEKAALTKTLAANQGLYNGFIAAGLIWGVYQGVAGNEFKLFFLSCVIVAGIYGALTASKKIIYVQTLPGVVALLLLLSSL